jgi:hypothetical protein
MVEPPKQIGRSLALDFELYVLNSWLDLAFQPFDPTRESSANHRDCPYQTGRVPTPSLGRRRPRFGHP